MTRAATNQTEPVIKYLNNESDIRVCYKSSRAVSMIQKMPDGRYQVVKLYDGEITECDSYNDAREEAFSAGMTKAPRSKRLVA